MTEFIKLEEIIYTKEKGQGFLSSDNYEKGLKRVNPDGFIEAYIKPEDLEAFDSFLREQKAQRIEAVKAKNSYDNNIYKYSEYIEQLNNKMADKEKQIQHLESRGAKLSKADGMKEQKRGKDTPDYVLDRVEINCKQSKYYYTYKTPYTLKALKLTLNNLEKQIQRDLEALNIFKNGTNLINITTFDGVFYVKIETQTPLA